jgi:methylated-DNA-protein-cysteine methyltransferase-like protein
MPRAEPTGSHARIHAVVSRIPRGRVATYGQVAELVGLPGGARQVGYALHALGAQSSVPWQRVINAKGRVSPRSVPGFEAVQRRLLEREGVAFGADDRVDLERYRWCPSASRRKGRR